MALDTSNSTPVMSTTTNTTSTITMKTMSTHQNHSLQHLYRDNTNNNHHQKLVNSQKSEIHQNNTPNNLQNKAIVLVQNDKNHPVLACNSFLNNGKDTNTKTTTVNDEKNIVASNKNINNKFLKNQLPQPQQQAKQENEVPKYIQDLNEFISCFLCKGYLIDATTIIECLHSFCKTCILKYFEEESNPKCRSCPKCDTQIHKTKPKLNIRSDPTLQDIVYKLVPAEMNRRKQFYLRFPEKAVGLSNEEKGEINGERLILSHDDIIQITIEYFPEISNPYKLLPFNNDENVDIKFSSLNQRRYLLLKAGMKVLHLKKFIRSKYELENSIQVDFFYKHELLKDDYTIMDLAYIYSWRRNLPIPLYYLILEPDKTCEDYLRSLSQKREKNPLSFQNGVHYGKSSPPKRTNLKRACTIKKPLTVRSRSSSLVSEETKSNSNGNFNKSLPLSLKLPVNNQASTVPNTVKNSLNTDSTIDKKVNGFTLDQDKESNKSTMKRSTIENGVESSISQSDVDLGSCPKKMKNENSPLATFLPTKTTVDKKSINDKCQDTELNLSSLSQYPILAKTLIKNDQNKPEAPTIAKKLSPNLSSMPLASKSPPKPASIPLEQDCILSTDLVLNTILKKVEEKVQQMNGSSDESKSSSDNDIQNSKPSKSENKLVISKPLPPFNIV